MNAQPKNKVRMHRVSRAPHREIADEATHLWAVSYSDFLMVLLCFFIIFFSVNADRDEMLRRIAAVGGSQTGSAHAGTDPGEGKGAARVPAQADPQAGPLAERPLQGPIARIADMKAQLAGMNVKVMREHDHLVLLLPNDLYSRGALELNEIHKVILKHTLNRIRPYFPNIHVTFVGHTDADPVKRPRSSVIMDNFDVSSLRATKALQFAVRSGFPARHLSAQGSAENDRNSRTLSLIISSTEGT